MNITSIHIYPVVSRSGSTILYGEGYIEIPLVSVSETASYLPKVVNGLEAPEITFAGKRAPENNFGALMPRTMDAVVILNPLNADGKSIYELRDELYRIISQRSVAEVEVRLIDNTQIEALQHVANVYGKVIGLQTNLFSSESLVALSIECENPIFSGPEQISLIPRPTDPIIPDWASGQDLVFSDNQSTAPHGLHMEFDIDAEYLDEVYFNLESYYYGELSSIEFSYVFSFLVPSEHDTYSVYIDSIYGQIEVSIVYTDSVLPPITHSVAHSLVQGSVLPSIHPGLNAFNIGAESIGVFSFRSGYHYSSYWGV